jgi:hypothetical protein
MRTAPYQNFNIRMEIVMSKANWIFLPLLIVTGTTFAQTLTDLEKAAAEGGIVVTNDPNIAAEVERRAQEIAARQQQQTSGASGGSGAASEPMPSKPHKAGHAKKHHKKHEGETGRAKPGSATSPR